MNKQKLSIITLLVITFVMLSVSTTQAQTIQDKAICYGYGTADLQPIGVGNTVFQYTEKVGFWVQIQEPPDVTYRMKWTDPDGSEFRNVAVTVVDKSGENWGIVFDSLNIAESLARNRLGVWTVELYADGNLEVSSEFQIINYSELLAGIQDIQDQVQDIIEAKDELQSNYNDLQDDYEALQVDYQELQAQVGTASDYEQLQNNYDDLQGDYEALKASQNSTRTMMYASIAVALVAVVVAVYFGVMKK